MSEKTKSGKALKICIGVVIVAIVAAVVILVLKLTGVLDINLSKKSKMVAGVEKLGESISEPLDKISKTSEKNGIKIKAYENLNSDSAIDISTEVSADIEELTISDLSSSEKASLKNAIDLANSTKLNMNLRYDGDESVYGKVSGNIDSTDISGEFLYDGKQAGVRSEELNSKWLTISEDDLNELFEESGVDLEELKDIYGSSLETTNKLKNSLTIDEKKQKEITKRYNDVLKNYVNDKSKELESEKATVSVNGKDKKCTKVTLKLDDDDIKDLLKDYVDAFGKDDDLKNILTDSLKAYTEMLEQSGVEDLEDISDYLDEMYDSLDDIKSEIDELEFDGKATLVVYASTTQVYRTDVIISAEENEIKLAITYNKDKTVADLSIKANGQSMKIATITITSKDDEYGIRVEAAKEITAFIGGEYYVECKYKTSKSKFEMIFDFKAGTYGSCKLSTVTDIDKNTDNEYSNTTVSSIDIDFPKYVTAKMKLTTKSSAKVGDVSIPTISSKDSVDITDDKALEEYSKEANKNGEKLMKELQSIKALEPFIEDIADELM